MIDTNCTCPPNLCGGPDCCHVVDACCPTHGPAVVADLQRQIDRLTDERNAAVCVAMRAGMNGYGMDADTARLGTWMAVNAWLKTPDEAAALAGSPGGDL